MNNSGLILNYCEIFVIVTGGDRAVSCPYSHPGSHVGDPFKEKRDWDADQTITCCSHCSEMEAQLRWTGVHLSCQHRQGRGLHAALCRNPRTWSDAWRLVGAPYLFTAAPTKVCLSRLLLPQQVAPGTSGEWGDKSVHLLTAVAYACLLGMWATPKYPSACPINQRARRTVNSGPKREKKRD